MSFRSLVHQILVKINPDPFYTVDLPQNTWDQPTRPERIPPKPGPTQRNYDDYGFTTTSRVTQKTWDQPSRPERIWLKTGPTQRNYDDYNFFTANPAQKTWDQPSRPERIWLKTGPTQRNYDDYNFFTANPAQKTWDQPSRPERILLKTGPTQRNYDDYIFYTTDPAQKIWDQPSRPERIWLKTGPTQRNYDDYIFYTLDPIQRVWDQPTLPPKPGRTQRNYDDQTFIAPPVSFFVQKDEILTLPPKPGRTQRNYDDYIFFAGNPAQKVWDQVTLPYKPRYVLRSNDYSPVITVVTPFVQIDSQTIVPQQQRRNNIVFYDNVIIAPVSPFTVFDGPLTLPGRLPKVQRAQQDDPKTYASNIVSSWSHDVMRPVPIPFTSNKRRVPYFDDPITFVIPPAIHPAYIVNTGTIYIRAIDAAASTIQSANGYTVQIKSVDTGTDQ